MKKKKQNLNFKSLVWNLFAVLLLISIQANSQSLEEVHNEVVDDPYISSPRSSMEKSPAYRMLGNGYFTNQVNIDENGLNIIGDAGNETSLAVDPNNPNRIVIGWRQFDTVTSNFRQAGYGYSLDGGLTWTFPGVLNPGIFRSDPVLDFDKDGNFYYNSLQSGFNCDVYKIDDGGVVWDSPVPAKGGDKQWMRIDRTDGIGSGNNYSNWNISFSTCDFDLTRSIDGSQSFEDCTNVNENPRWGTLAVDADGTIYTCGQSGSELIVVKSTTAKDPSIPVTWDSHSVVDLDGSLSIGGAVNPQGLLGQMWVDVDISGGESHGNVYVLASVNRNSIADSGDVMFARSEDGGETFSSPIRINTDEGTDHTQWFGTMAVAPNGRIDVVWLDTRDAPNGTNDSVLYYSFSEDHGNSWTENKAISEPFNPNIGYPQQNKMGDYFDMVSDNNGVHLAWANTINGGQDVYYTHIDPVAILGLNNSVAGFEDAKIFPNPFRNETQISFSVKNSQNIKVAVYDMLGRNQVSLFDRNVSGIQNIYWDGTSGDGQKLPNGIYFIQIEGDTKKSILKAIIK